MLEFLWMKKKGHLEKVVAQNEIEVEDEYKYLDLGAIVKNKAWLTFKIITKSLRNDTKIPRKESCCGVCLKPIASLDERIKLACCHMFHEKCLEKINYLDIPCIYCHF